MVGLSGADIRWGMVKHRGNLNFRLAKRRDQTHKIIINEGSHLLDADQSHSQ